MVQKKISEEAQPRKSFLDRPLKEIFSFNVDREVGDVSERSRRIAAKILGSDSIDEVTKDKIRKNFEKQGIRVEPRKKSILERSFSSVFSGFSNDTWGLVLIIGIAIASAFISTWLSFGWITLCIILFIAKINKRSRMWD